MGRVYKTLSPIRREELLIDKIKRYQKTARDIVAGVDGIYEAFPEYSEMYMSPGLQEALHDLEYKQHKQRTESPKGLMELN